MRGHINNAAEIEPALGNIWTRTDENQPDIDTRVLCCFIGKSNGVFIGFRTRKAGKTTVTWINDATNKPFPSATPSHWMPMPKLPE